MDPKDLLHAMKRIAAVDPSFSFSQLQVLMEIYMSDGNLKATDIATRLGTNPATVGRFLDKISYGYHGQEGLNWVRRVKPGEGDDRRHRRLEMTAEGRRFMDTVLTP